MGRTPIIRLVCLLAMLVSTAGGRSLAETPVTFPAAEPGVTLNGLLAVPEGDGGPAPAVVFLHGCSGLGGAGGVYASYRDWSDHLVAAGFAVLMVDSAGSRGLGRTCGASPARPRMYRERPGDAYAALAFLQTRNSVDPMRIGLVGWSQGGGIVLLTIASESVGRPTPTPAHDFKAAVAFYPSACSERLQSRPYTTVGPGQWRPIAPLLVLQGGADNWTRPEPCVAFVEAVRARGHPVEIVVYPGAVHSFDAPDRPVRPRTGITTARGEHPLVGTDEAARKDAFARVTAFLRARLAMP